MLSCTRWVELVDSMKFHAGLAKAASAPTEFRILNSSQKFLVGAGPDTTGYSGLMHALDQSPGITTYNVFAIILTPNLLAVFVTWCCRWRYSLVPSYH